MELHGSLELSQTTVILNIRDAPLQQKRKFPISVSLEVSFAHPTFSPIRESKDAA